MALKRKRSSPGFSSPASDTTSTSTDSNNGSLPFFYAQSKPTEPLYHKPTWSFPTYDDGAEQYRSVADMNSRTRKRHRDDRPGEEVVYCMIAPLDAALRAQELKIRASKYPISTLQRATTASSRRASTFTRHGIHCSAGSTTTKYTALLLADTNSCSSSDV